MPHALSGLGHPISHRFSPFEIVCCLLVILESGWIPVCLVEKELAWICLRSKDVEADIVGFQPGLPGVVDCCFYEILCSIRFNPHGHAGHVHDPHLSLFLCSDAPEQLANCDNTTR